MAKVKSSKGKSKEITNWASKPESELYKKCSEMYPTIETAYRNREDADKDIDEYWNIYNATPDDNQGYDGNSKCYLPVVRDAINARAKRALRQLFPTKYHHVEAVGADNQTPHAQLALLEHYIRDTKLKSIVRSILIAGDVTGQWNCYVDWNSSTRNMKGVIKRNPIMQNMEGEDLEIESPVEEDSDSDDVVEQGPEIIDFATEDLVVIPPTCNDINKCDISCLRLRMSKDKIKSLIDDGIFIIKDDGDLKGWIDSHKGDEFKNTESARVSDAGIKTKGTNKYALIFWAQVYLEFEKGVKSLADVYFAGPTEIVGIIKAPQWGQKRSIISAPVDRVGGSFHGISKIEGVKFLQWNLNDFWNMGQDSAMYSLLPIVMTDPAKNPNYAMMVYGLAAVWPVDPASTRIENFPQLWKDAVGICEAAKAQVHQSMDVNEMMMGMMPKGRKNAPMVGAQQQEQSISVIDHAERFEQEILNVLMERWVEYDAQFRKDEITILTQGEIGVKAAMQKIPPQQWGQRFFFQWTGTDFTMNMMRMQQQIALMNVLRGIPPQQLNGRKLDISPILDKLVENVFGSELGQKILIDDRNKFTIPAPMEDEMMANGIPIEVHEFDEDMEHIQSHQQAGQRTQDLQGIFRTHIQAHIMQLQKKRQMAMGAQQQGQPGVPGGAGPGVPGTPRPGAQPAPGRPVQNPPGAIPQGNLPGGTPQG